MVPGLPQGYVRFGSMAERVLKYLYEIGDARHRDLVEDLDAEPREISVTLARLAKFKFIFPVGKVSTYETGDKTQMLWTLKPRKRPKPFKRATTSERTAVYRERKRRRANSVFNWRGKYEYDQDHLQR